LPQHTEQKKKIMGTLNAILGQPDNEQISDKQRNYPSTLTQQGASSVQQSVSDNEGTNNVTDGLVSSQENDADKKKSKSVNVVPSPVSRMTNQSEPAAKRTMSYVEMMQQLSPYKPPTEEELAKERRKQKRETVFAAIGDGLNAFHLAYANQRGVKPLTTNVSMSGMVRDRYEKLKKERDARTQEYLNAYLRAAQADQQQENWRDTFKYNQERDEKSDAWRKSEANRQQGNLDRQQGNLDRQFEYQKGRDEKSDEFRQQQFEESKRQFNVSSSQAQQRINMESSRLSREMQKENVTFALGTGKGTISVPTSTLNASNVAYVFSKLPEEVRATVQGEPIIKDGKQVTRRVKREDGTFESVPVYAKPTTDAMLIAIGSNIENAPAAQDALREIAGQKADGKKPNPMGGNDKKPNPMS